MQAQLEAEARKIIESVSKYQYWGTLDVEASPKSPLYFLQGSLQGQQLCLGYNIGGAYMSPEEARLNIEKVRSYYHQLYAASAFFRDFMAEKEVIFEISVNSGHMSFIVAQAQAEGEIKVFTQ